MTYTCCYSCYIYIQTCTQYTWELSGLSFILLGVELQFTISRNGIKRQNATTRQQHIYIISATDTLSNLRFRVIYQQPEVGQTSEEFRNCATAGEDRETELIVVGTNSIGRRAGIGWAGGILLDTGAREVISRSPALSFCSSVARPFLCENRPQSLRVTYKLLSHCFDRMDIEVHKLTLSKDDSPLTLSCR